jgi:hypothetical protein
MPKTESDSGTTQLLVSKIDNADAVSSLEDALHGESAIFDDTNLTDATAYNAPHGPAKSGQRSISGD